MEKKWRSYGRDTLGEGEQRAVPFLDGDGEGRGFAAQVREILE